MTDKQQAQLQILCRYVFETWIVSGSDLDAAEIAKGLGWSVTKVRGLLREHGHERHGIRDQSRWINGMHSKLVYGPTREALRNYIRQLRRWADAQATADKPLTFAEAFGLGEHAHHE